MKSVKITCEGASKISLDKLLEFQGNLKSLSDENYRRCRASILKHGMSFPVCVWRTNKAWIIDGHQRVITLKRMRDEDGYQIPDIPVSWIHAKTKKEAAQKVLAATSQYGQISDDGLHQFMTDFELDIDDVAESFTFPEIDLPNFAREYFPDSQMVKSEDERAAAEDDVPEVPKKAKSRLGNIYQLGEHRLMCGNSTDRLQVERLIGNSGIDSLITDPPYGINIVKGSVGGDKPFGAKGAVGGGGILRAGRYSEIIGDDTIETAAKTYALALALKIKTIVLWGGNYYSEFCPPTSGWLIWDKLGNTESNNFADCELAWTNRQSPARIHRQMWRGMIKQGEYGRRVHPTQKPVDLAIWSIEITNGSANNILDLFGGSGSTLIACEKTNRKCFMMEIDPHYVDIIIERWQKYTGKTAELLNGKR